MTTELDRVKLKIKALAAKTVANGCSEHEALSAMQGVGRLLSQYNLTMEECDVRTSPCRTIYMDIGRLRRHPIDGCVCALADLVGGKVWFHWEYKLGQDMRYHKTTSYAFFAKEDDTVLLEYLFKTIHRAMGTESEAFKHRLEWMSANDAGSRRSATVSFQHGMARRLSERLEEIKKENDAELVRARSDTGRALVVLKKQLVEEEFKANGPKLRSYSHSRRVSNQDAYYAGKAAGDKVNLNRPVTGSGKVGGLLK